MTTLTPTQFNALTDEEKKQYETALAKALVRKVAIHAAVVGGVQLALHFIGKRYDKKHDENED